MPPRTRRVSRLSPAFVLTQDSTSRLQFALPQDYTFAPIGVPIHKASHERVTKLLEQTSNRDPDRFDLYIYNGMLCARFSVFPVSLKLFTNTIPDYFGYAVLDLVDSTLSTIHTHVIKKRWLDAWHALDALAKYNEMFGDWISASSSTSIDIVADSLLINEDVDDGDRVRITESAHGALIVTTIRALDAAGQLNRRDLPDLSYTLRDMAEWTGAWWDTLDTSYHTVLKAYGKKLFGGQTQEEREREKEVTKKAYNDFVKRLSPDEREKGQYEFWEDEDEEEGEDEDEDDEQSGTTMWYDDGDLRDINKKDTSFSVSSTWKKYKE